MKSHLPQVFRPVLIVSAALTIASPASAAIDLENMESRVGKSAADASVIFEKPKSACVCLSNTTAAVVGKAGVLRQSRVTEGGITRIRVDCRVVGFNSTTGALAVQQDCSDFVPLPK